MKYRYLIVSCYGDEPVGTNDADVAAKYMPLEDYYVIDAQTGEQLYIDDNDMQVSADLKEVK